VADAGEETMSFCEHCEGQRFDRARVLRALRQLRKELQGSAGRRGDAALKLALETIRSLEIPHMDVVDPADEVVH
jgi:hypothetical protein